MGKLTDGLPVLFNFYRMICQIVKRQSGMKQDFGWETAMAYNQQVPLCRGISRLAAAVFFLMLGFGLFPAKTTAHLDENLVGVPPSDLSEWNYYGIGEEESAKWIAEGIIFAGWAAQWKGEGFSADAAGRWHEIVNVHTAGDFHRNGFGPEEAKEWMDYGIRSGERAREYLDGGLDAREASTFWKKGLYPQEAKKWWAAGFDAAAMLRWHYGPIEGDFYLTRGSPYSRTVYDLNFARSWRDAGFKPEEAQRASKYRFELAEMKTWQAAGFSFDEAVQWKDSGFSLPEAVASRDAGLSPLDAELKRYEASAREDEISELSVDITVKKDGTLDIVEAVTFIDRPFGNFREGYYKYPSPAHVKSVEVNGLPGGYVVAGNALQIKKDDTPLPEGEHRITLAYTTDTLVWNKPHLDELRFAVVAGVQHGNYLRNVSATVRLPKGAHLIFADGNAGLPERKDFAVEIEDGEAGDVVRYVVTRPLTGNMAFGVDLGFVKGYATASWLHKLGVLDRQSMHFLSSLLIFVAGLAVTFFYYWAAWFRVGRDPQGRGAAITEFSPPEDILPPQMRALLGRRGKNHLSTVAELLSLAERGFLRIFEWEGAYKIEKTEKNSVDLPDWEQDFLATMFRDRNRVILTGRPERKQLSQVSQVLKASFERAYRTHTEQNSRYVWPGIILSLLFLGASLAVIDAGRLLAGEHGGTILVLYAALLAAGSSLLPLLFARLLRRPTREYVQLLERLQAYVEFLKRNFPGLNNRTYVMPLLQGHLPYAIAAGIDADRLMIRNGEANWYKGASGGFVCGDFIAAIKRSL